MSEYIRKEDVLKAVQSVKGCLDNAKNKYGINGLETQVWDEIINAVYRVINRIPEFNQPQETDRQSQTGWICPKCGVANAPWMKKCICSSIKNKMQV